MRSAAAFCLMSLRSVEAMPSRRCCGDTDRARTPQKRSIWLLSSSVCEQWAGVTMFGYAASHQSTALIINTHATILFSLVFDSVLSSVSWNTRKGSTHTPCTSVKSIRSSRWLSWDIVRRSTVVVSYTSNESGFSVRGGGRKGWCEEWARSGWWKSRIFIPLVLGPLNSLVWWEVPLGYIALGWFLFLQEQIKDIIIIVKRPA